MQGGGDVLAWNYAERRITLDSCSIIPRVTNQPLTGVQDNKHASATPVLTLITTICGGGTCPTVYRTDRNTFVVQGYTVTAEAAGLDLPAGEQLVEIPAELFEAVRASS